MPKNEGLKLLEDLVRRTYLVKDPYIVKVLVVHVITQFLAGDPLWLFLVAASGGCKSEFINMISKVTWTPEGKDPQKVWPVSTLTENTFISGMKTTTESSLLLQIGSGIISIKDFTSIMAEKAEKRTVLMGQFREIYDGHYSKPYGNGQTKKWDGKITLLAGATHTIHDMRQAYTSMGERFTFYDIEQPDRHQAALQTMINQESGTMQARRDEISVVCGQLVSDILDVMPADAIKLDDATRNEIITLSEFATRSRSAIEHDWKTKEIVAINPPEMPTRFAGGLQVYLMGAKVVNYYTTGETVILPEDKKVVYKMALDSITNIRRMAMIELARYTTMSTGALGMAMHLPSSSALTPLADLHALDVISRREAIKGMREGKGYRWSIKEEYRQILRQYENIQLLGEEKLDPAGDAAPSFDKSQYEGESIAEVNAQLDLEGGLAVA
jgi:hypothetical protein